MSNQVLNCAFFTFLHFFRVPYRQIHTLPHTARRRTLLYYLLNATRTQRNPIVLYSTPVWNDPPQSILIVDDDDMIVELLCAGFQQFGFKIHKAADGLGAWQLFERESIDVVLTDIRMPGMSGSELCRRIRGRSSSTLLAVMTGGDPDRAVALLNDGTADHFFQKPFDIIEVCQILLTEIQAV